LQKVKNDLLMVMSTVQSKNKQLEEDLKREQQWHEEQEQVLHVLNKLEEETKTQAKQLYKPRYFYMKKEVLKLKTYKQELLKALYEFLEEHFPLPEKVDKKSSCLIHFLNLILLVFQILINKLMYEPHDPYVTINDSFWPPYIELLLRNGIAQRHSEDVNKIRLEAFHM
ncbi:CENPK protein, partial [Podargus strigoides]|nr:CENPK protein [Podargus strigoides]